MKNRIIKKVEKSRLAAARKVAWRGGVALSGGARALKKWQRRSKRPEGQEQQGTGGANLPPVCKRASHQLEAAASHFETRKLGKRTLTRHPGSIQCAADQQ